jgi:hypothetical protein
MHVRGQQVKNIWFPCCIGNNKQKKIPPLVNLYHTSAYQTQMNNPSSSGPRQNRISSQQGAHLQVTYTVQIFYCTKVSRNRKFLYLPDPEPSFIYVLDPDPTLFFSGIKIAKNQVFS